MEQQGLAGMNAAEFSGALYGALSKRQVIAEARRRGWAGDDARTGKSALCDWLAQHVDVVERQALLDSGAAQLIDAPAEEKPVEQPQVDAPMPDMQPAARTARFACKCRACGENITAGAAIAKDSAGHWVHVHCAAAKVEQPQRKAAEQPASNADTVARAIAAALAQLEVRASAGVDADAVRAIVREELRDVRPVEVRIGERAAVRIDARTHPLFDKVLRLVQSGVNVLLVGPAGCGKSYLAKQVAEAMGRTYGTLHCSAGVSESQVTGWLLPVGKGGEFKFQPSHFATLYAEGNSVFLIDEIDAADPNMLTVLNGALANGALHIPQCVEKPEWKRGKDAAIIAAANTYGQGADAVYVGRNQLDAATLDRFYVVEMDYDAALEADILRASGHKDAATFSDWVKALRTRAKDARLRRVVSTRTLQKGLAALDAGISLRDVKRDLLAGWTRDEMSKVGE